MLVFPFPHGKSWNFKFFKFQPLENPAKSWKSKNVLQELLHWDTQYASQTLAHKSVKAAMPKDAT